jgi:uncharacterized protein (DUF1330 family)
MSRYVTIGISMFAGAALASGVIQALHAQAKPPAYVVAEITVNDQDGYTKNYVPLITKSIQESGGKFLARGGQTTSLLGDPPAKRIVILQFDSLDKAKAWGDSKDYKDAQAVGTKTATIRSYAVEGVSP